MYKRSYKPHTHTHKEIKKCPWCFSSRSLHTFCLLQASSPGIAALSLLTWFWSLFRCYVPGGSALTAPLHHASLTYWTTLFDFLHLYLGPCLFWWPVNTQRLEPWIWHKQARMTISWMNEQMDARNAFQGKENFYKRFRFTVRKLSNIPSASLTNTSASLNH